MCFTGTVASETNPPVVLGGGWFGLSAREPASRGKEVDFERQRQTAHSEGDQKQQSLPGDAPRRVARDGGGLCSATRGLATRQRTLCRARCRHSGAGGKLISDIVTAGWPLVAASHTIRPSRQFGSRQIFFPLEVWCYAATSWLVERNGIKKN